MSTCIPSTSSTNCPCDSFTHPMPLDIAAGLYELPRQIASFPEFRRAMLLAISEYGPLVGWQARKDEDLGVMLLEMWAYVCDVLAFYDGVISHESYLRTARLRPSVRKLVGLLGYLPRPATAATASLAAIASGRQMVTVPYGTAFKSKAFGAEPPQTFELDADTNIHPFTNQLEIKRVPYTTLGTISNPPQLTVLPLGDINEEDLVVLSNIGGSPALKALFVTANAKYKGDDGMAYNLLTFNATLNASSTTLLANLSLRKPNGTAKLWSRGTIGSAFTTSLSNYTVTLNLDRQYTEFRAGESIVVRTGGSYHAVSIYSVTEVELTASTGNTISINGSTFNMPSIKVPVTQVVVRDFGLYQVLQMFVAFGSIEVHYNMTPVAKVVREPSKTLVAGNPLNFTAVVEDPLAPFAPTEFILEDKNNVGQWLEGGLTNAKDGLDIPNQADWTSTLTAPVKAYGNIIAVSRGESVYAEVLGSGNASKASQQFTLKKKPLTYFLSPTLDNDQGVKSTLVVYVDGIQWMEVTSFYGAGPEDQIYIVRQTDEGESVVTFGDGIRGSRLPSGSRNVVANYRFGAGAATPPAGSITQIGKAVTGLQSVVNPVAASAGADAEAQEDIRENGPQSILILGRAVSMKDMEAVAQGVPGVRVVQAEWRWSANAQRPTAHIWYVGTPDLDATITERLRNVTEANTAFDIVMATPRTIRLSISVGYDPRYDTTQLSAAIQDILLNEDYGFLLPESQGIGQNFFRSQLFATVLSIAGTTSIQGVFWAEGNANSTPFSSYGKRQYAGNYWDFETYPPVITLSEESV